MNVVGHDEEMELMVSEKKKQRYAALGKLFGGLCGFAALQILLGSAAWRNVPV